MKELILDRDKKLAALDMDWARKMMPLATSDEVRLLSMHKARYECTSIADELRHESRRWIEQRGYHRIGYLPWPPEDQLPE